MLGGVARIDDEPRRAHDEIVIVGRVIGGDEHAILRGQVFGRQGLTFLWRHMIAALYLLRYFLSKDRLHYEYFRWALKA